VHEIPERKLTELGTVWLVHVVPPSVLTRTTPSPVSKLEPTVKHAVLTGHDTPPRKSLTDDWTWAVQEPPPSLEVRITPPPLPDSPQLPVATQSEAE
jgi:hypothetical protein